MGVREGRRDALSMLKDLESEGGLGQDDRHRAEKSVQDLTDDVHHARGRADGREGEGGPRGLRPCRRGGVRGRCPEEAGGARARKTEVPAWPRTKFAATACPGTSPSSWTATGAGPRRRGSSETPDTARASRPSATVLRAANDLGVRYLTLYAFSQRELGPPAGRGARADAPARALPRGRDRRGDGERHPRAGDGPPRAPAARDPTRRSRAPSRAARNNEAMTLVFALSYGGRDGDRRRGAQDRAGRRGGRARSPRHRREDLRLLPLRAGACPIPTC